MTTTDRRPEPDMEVRDEVEALLIELGVRYEVIDGSVVVMPSATFRHEDLSGHVYAQLRMQAPDGIAVLGANYNFYYASPSQSFVCGDVLVARTEDCGECGIYVPPLLMVEALSKSTRRHDLTLKWGLYAEAGVPSYWILDPVERTLLVLDLVDGVYVETASVGAGETLTVTVPFPASITI